jgi:hypothetical protein
LQILYGKSRRHVRIRSCGIVANAIFAEEHLERRPDVFLPLDLHGLKIGLLNLRKKLNHAAAIVACSQRFDLAVAKQVRNLGELFGCFQSRRIIRLEIVTVGTVKGVDIPETRMIPLIDDL